MAEQTAKKSGDTADTPARVVISIQSNGEDKSPVYLSMNGDTVLIKRDEDVEVPGWVPAVLDSATRPVKIGEVNDDKLGEAKRYSYSIKG